MLQGVDNVGMSASTLTWTQLANTRPECITGYIISWSSGSVTTSTTATSISAAELNTNGFPYCQNLSVTVTPNTPIGPMSTGAGSVDVLFQIPGIYQTLLKV